MNIGEAAKRASIRWGGGAAALDPTTILTFFDAIKAFLDAIKQCRQSAADSIRAIREPGFFQSLRARKMLRDMYVLTHAEALQLWVAIRDTGAELTEEEADELLRANDRLEV